MEIMFSKGMLRYAEVSINSYKFSFILRKKLVAENGQTSLFGGWPEEICGVNQIIILGRLPSKEFSE